MPQDETLSQLIVDRVEPAPDVKRLRLVMTCLPGAEIAPAEALARLEAATGWLRTEVASTIHRKQAPQLTFGWRSP